MENYNALVSVLIPTYNGVGYIKETVDNILSSTYRNIEIVCVDDFSTDGTPSLLKKLSESDSRVKVVQRTERGGDGAKGITYGLPFCSGEYFFYMSQDDLVSDDCIEKCVCRCNETGLDVAIPDTVFYVSGKMTCRRLCPPNGDYSQIMDGTEAFRRAAMYNLSGFCLKRMSLVRRIGFEDHLYDSCDKSCLLHYYYAKKVCFVDAEFYYRIDNRNAITHGWRALKFETLLTYVEGLEFMVKEHMPDHDIRLYVECLLDRFDDFEMHLDPVRSEERETAYKTFTKAKTEFRSILKRRWYWRALLTSYVGRLSVARAKRVVRLAQYHVYKIVAPQSESCRRLYARLHGIDYVGLNASNGTSHTSQT